MHISWKIGFLLLLNNIFMQLLKIKIVKFSDSGDGYSRIIQPSFDN